MKVKLNDFSGTGCQNSYSVTLKDDNLVKASELLGVSLWGFDGQLDGVELIVECAIDMSYIQYLLHEPKHGSCFEHDNITFEEFCNVLLAVQ